MLSKFLLVRSATALESFELDQFVLWLRSSQYLQCFIFAAGDSAGTLVWDWWDWWVGGGTGLANRIVTLELMVCNWLFICWNWASSWGIVAAGSTKVPTIAVCTLVVAWVSTSQISNFERVSLTQVLKA